MKDLKWYGLLAVVVIIAYIGVTRWLADQVTQQHEERFNELQQMQTELGARSIEDHAEWVLSEISLLADYHLPEALNDPANDRAALDHLLGVTIHHAYPSEQSVIHLVDPAGETLAYYNDLTGDESVSGNVLLRQWLNSYTAIARETNQPYITPFYATADAKLYGVLHPVQDDDGTYHGMLAVLMDFNPVIQKYVAPMRSGNYGAAWLQTTSSYILYHREPELIGEFVVNLAKPYPDLQAINRRFVQEDQGSGSYHFTIELGGPVDRKLVSWSTLHIGNQRMTLALSAPEDEINADLASHRQAMQILGLLLGSTLVFSSVLYYATRQRALERLVTSRTLELKTLNADLEARVAARTAELTAKNAELTTILETMNDGVVFRRDGQIVYSNTAVTRLFGYTPDELAENPEKIQQQVMQQVPPQRLKHIRHAFQRTVRHAGIHTENMRLTRKDGQTLDASIYMAPIIGPQGEQLGTLEIIHDISHQLALQEQKDRFITNASHELRRPLSNLKTRLYLLRQQPDGFAAHMAVLERAADDMSALVHDLVEVAQLTRDVAQFERQPVQLQTILTAAQPLIEAQVSREDVQVSYTTHSTPITVTGDYQRLVNAYSNLIIHAINATAAETTVHVDLSIESGTNVIWGVLRVHNHEPHMSLDDLTHVFDPFHRASEGNVQSTGLGLTLTHLTIEGHGGTLEASNVPNGGIIYSARIPSRRTSPFDTPTPS